MTGLESAVCEQCGQAVLTGFTDTHRRTVLDPDPATSPWYAYTLIWQQGRPTLHLLSLADILRADSLEIRPRLYAPHFLRCASLSAEQVTTVGSR